jgi:hypothetical protein
MIRLRHMARCKYYMYLLTYLVKQYTINLSIEHCAQRVRLANHRILGLNQSYNIHTMINISHFDGLGSTRVKTYSAGKHHVLGKIL